MSLSAWLQRIEAMHPKSIEMGLERLRPVVRNILEKQPIARRVITVAGTNGKGSTCRTLESLALAYGWRTGCYTSPHLFRFNERIRVQGLELDDDEIVAAFETVEAARQDVPLTYFEFTTLAAFVAFRDRDLDLAILEVGLGGRLDAVNSVDPYVAVITTVDLDHQDWLGSDREQIGREKAGILRAGLPVVIGEAEPPQSVLDEAARLGCRLFRLKGQHDWDMQPDGCWTARWQSPNGLAFQRTGLPPVRLPPQNLVTGLQAFQCLIGESEPAGVVDVLSTLELEGRMQQVGDHPRTFVDVGHNPQAARFLKAHMAIEKEKGRQVVALFSALADKDIEGIVRTLEPVVDAWLIWPLQGERAAPLSRLQAAISTPNVLSCASVEEALHESMAAFTASQPVTRFAFGSFLVVESVGRALGRENEEN